MIDERQTDLVAEPIITGNIKKAISEAGGRSDDLWIVDPFKCFHEASDNVRPLDPAEVDDKAQKMLANGYDKSKPIGGFVRKVGDENRIYIHEGQHRFFGARRAIELGTWAHPDLAFTTIPLILYPRDQLDRKQLIIRGINANGSKQLTPLQLAENIADLQREGMTQAEICAQLNITSQTVRDVMLLLEAPADLHQLIRDKAITSTLAIKTIRDVGTDKALGVIEKALSVATKDGRTKVTQKNLDLPAIQKGKPAKKAPAKARAESIEIPNRLAKQLLFAAVAAYCSQSFREDSPGFVEISTVLNVFCDFHAQTDDDAPKASASEQGALDGSLTESIRSPKWAGSYVEINVARGQSGHWYVSHTYQIGTTYRGGPVFNQGTAYSSRRLAVAGGAVALSEFLPFGQKTRENKHTSRAVAWLEDLAVRALLGKI